MEDNEGIFIENAISLSVLLVSSYPNHRILFPLFIPFIPTDNRLNKKGHRKRDSPSGSVLSLNAIFALSALFSFLPSV